MPHCRKVRVGLAAGATLSVLVAMGAASAPAAAGATGWVATATRATSIPGATLGGDAAKSAPLYLAVTLKPQNVSAEQSALKAMYQPGSATFHDFLTPAQWVAAYAPTTAQVEAVTSYLSQNGFTGVSVQGDQLLITASGTVADAETAFDTTIGDYTMPNGGTFQANVGAAEVPAALGGIVQAVVGLSDWKLPTPSPAPMTEQPATTGSPVIPNEIPPKDFQNTYDAAGTSPGAQTWVALFRGGAVRGAST